MKNNQKPPKSIEKLAFPKAIQDKESLKKLKKVDENELNSRLISLCENLFNAYNTKDAIGIDDASKELFEFYEVNSILKEGQNYQVLRNYTWQKNHVRIIGCISDLMNEKNRMPTNTEISAHIGLSDQTIYKHLKEFKNHDLYKHENDKFLIMRDIMLVSVYNLGMQKQNLKACKVYLDYFSNQDPKPKIETTNYIQINNTILNQSDFEQLDEHSQKQILTIIGK